MDESETDTWYVLADGTHAHPGDVERDDHGVLKSKNGVPVALRDNGLPLTSGVATKSNRQAARAGRKPGKPADAGAGGDAKTDLLAGSDPAKQAETADQKPGDQQGAQYSTRESTAE